MIKSENAPISARPRKGHRIGAEQSFAASGGRDIGNGGGDGETDKPLFRNLVTQCTKMGLTFVDETPSQERFDSEYDLCVDALFGFSFKPPVRPGFVDIVQRMTSAKIPVASVDVPSGWDVEKGDLDGQGIKPETLISLTAPKLCANKFEGKHHYLGGRFVPEAIKVKYSLNLPDYPENDSYVKL